MHNNVVCNEPKHVNALAGIPKKRQKLFATPAF